MKKIISILLFLVAGALVYFSQKKSAHTNDLVIYSYSSFASEWGAGPYVIKEFEKLHNIKISLVDVGDARTILQRLELEKSNPKADVVIGLDHLILDEAMKTANWEKVKIDGITYAKDFPEKKVMFDTFVPFDWAPMTFIYREGEVPPPRTLEELSATNYKKGLVLFDPRTSGPGYLFADWIVRLLGFEKAKSYLNSIKENILTVTPSWSAGYGLFQTQKAHLVFSYVTSAVYHWTKKDYRYKAAEFMDPVPYHIEYASVPSDCNKCDLAKKFVQFLLTSEIQKKIMETNYMYPVVEGIKDGTEFAKLPKLKIMEVMIAPDKSAVLDAWKSVSQ